MRGWLVLLLLAFVQADPARILSDRFGFSATEIAAAKNGQPVVKMLKVGAREELGIAGAIRLSGKKERLADWLRNIEHFRNSAQLGTTHVIPMPPTPAAFAGVPADPGVREDLFRWAAAYVNAGTVAYPDAMRGLIDQARTMNDLVPELVTYLTASPRTPPANVDQLMYWASMPGDSAPILSVHHLVVYHPPGREIWIADKTIYATRYIDAGILAIALYDAPGADGFYAIAGSRLRSSKLGGTAAAILRGRIESSAADTVNTNLEWLRDSLALS
jgi:hypothetical protein